MRRMGRLFALAVLLWDGTAAAFDHGEWETLLARHVVPLRGGVATQVDYAGMQGDRATLKRYLDRLAAVPPEAFARWPAAERLAFLISSGAARG